MRNAITVPTIIIRSKSGTEIVSRFFSVSISQTAITTITIPQKIELATTGISTPNAASASVEKASPQTFTCSPKNPTSDTVKSELTRSRVPLRPKVDVEIAHVGIPRSAPWMPNISVSTSTIP